MTDKENRVKPARAGESSDVWTDEERAVMKETARERKETSRRSPEEQRAEGERDVFAKIEQMAPLDREMARRIHALVKTSAPDLVPRTWYGMPAYSKDGKVICFFQAASKFKLRYATFGFQPDARVDDGTMWPVAYALIKLTPADEAKIAELVKRAVAVDAA